MINNGRNQKSDNVKVDLLGFELNWDRSCAIHKVDSWAYVWPSQIMLFEMARHRNHQNHNQCDFSLAIKVWYWLAVYGSLRAVYPMLLSHLGGSRPQTLALNKLTVLSPFGSITCPFRQSVKAVCLPDQRSKSRWDKQICVIQWFRAPCTKIYYPKTEDENSELMWK